MSEHKKREANGKIEPAWIRNVEATDMVLDVPPDAVQETLVQLFDGIVVHCALCGEAFPCWPVAPYAIHYTSVHGMEITVQQMQGLSEMTKSQYGQAHIGWIQQLLMTRVEVRRRAWKMNLWQRLTPPAETSRIVRPD